MGLVLPGENESEVSAGLPGNVSFGFWEQAWLLHKTRIRKTGYNITFIFIASFFTSKIVDIPKMYFRRIANIKFDIISFPECIAKIQQAEFCFKFKADP